MEPSTILEAAIKADSDAAWAREAAADTESCLVHLQQRRDQLVAQVAEIEEANGIARTQANEALGLAEIVPDSESLNDAQTKARRVMGCREQVEQARTRVHEVLFA